MIKKIVVITPYPFNQRDFNRFGVELLRSNGLGIEIWDISSFLHGKKFSQEIQEITEKFQDLRIFKEKYEIINAISSLEKGCLINCFIEYSYRTFFIFRTISKHKIPYCVVGMVSVPNPYSVQINYYWRIASALNNINSQKIIDILQYFLNKILLDYYFIFDIAPASIILLSGEKSLGGTPAYPVNTSTTRLWTHSLDYDIYMQQKTDLNNPHHKNGVFLDEYLPFHPDFNDVGIEDPISPDNYYHKICDFFKILEKKLDTEIVIAAHPRSEYNNSTDYFGGRTIIKGETARLVNESSFVISHMSTSISFAVLYHKPIIFITSDDLQKMSSGKNITGLYIQTIASELGKIPINIDHDYDFNFEKEMIVDEQAYVRYKNYYIKKPGTPEKPMWEIFCSHIRQNFP